MEYLGKIYGAVTCIVLSCLWRGYVLSLLWSWYMVTIFGMRPLTMPMCIGLSTVVGMMSGSGVTYNDHTRPPIKDMIFGSFIAPTIGLLMGWIAKQFI
jgi:hypothetical protein